MVGSLTGAVSSQRVTEERKGTLSTVGHRAMSAKVKGCLTARLTRRAGAKAGESDPAPCIEFILYDHVGGVSLNG
jgi:hypothetical protein